MRRWEGQLRQEAARPEGGRMSELGSFGMRELGWRGRRDQGVARRRGRLPHGPGCARLHRVTLGAQVGNLPHIWLRDSG